MRTGPDQRAATRPAASRGHRGAAARGGVLAIALAISIAACSRPEQERRIAVEPFEVVMALVPRATPQRVIVLISGDNGVDSRLIALGRGLARRGDLALLIDRRLHRKQIAARPDAEVDLAADFAAIAPALARELSLGAGLRTTLVGIDAGAGEAYAALAQAAPDAFAGAIGVRFCPTLALPKPAAARGALTVAPGETAHTQRLVAAPGVRAPFVALIGQNPTGCPPTATADFVKASSNASLMVVDGLDAGRDGQERWRDELDAAIDRIASETAR